ncbi:uncharacterized protein [Nicotiana tomentosiformis]|uniref:uncharacterized protein n=1 Tax=Nicotiana tomentosiformis TaxID=4098 RepID=UPI00388C7862
MELLVKSVRTTRLINNEAEYEAMIAGLELAKSLGAEVIEAKYDSLLVVNQVNKTFKVLEDRMQRYLDKLQVTLHRFKEWTLQLVPREQNSEADAIANLESPVEEYKIDSGTVIQLSRSIIEGRNAEINSTSLTWDWRNRRMFDGQLAVCLGLEDTDYVLREVHEGTCGNHSGPEPLIRKIIKAGYYWDSMEKDTKEFV